MLHTWELDNSGYLGLEQVVICLWIKNHSMKKSFLKKSWFKNLVTFKNYLKLSVQINVLCLPINSTTIQGTDVFFGWGHSFLNLKPYYYLFMHPFLIFFYYQYIDVLYQFFSCISSVDSVTTVYRDVGGVGKWNYKR